MKTENFSPLGAGLFMHYPSGRWFRYAKEGEDHPEARTALLTETFETLRLVPWTRLDAVQAMGVGTPSVALALYAINVDDDTLGHAKGEEAWTEHALRTAGRARFIPTTEWDTLPLSTKQELVAQRLEATGVSNAMDVVRKPIESWFIANAYNQDSD